MSASPFDVLAADYDRQWTDAPVGRMQRSAVWTVLDPLVRPEMRVLDLGCGTGEDSLHLAARGAVVDALDESPAMVNAARSKGVAAHVMKIQESVCPTSYDLILSNFGVINCIDDLNELSRVLNALVRPGGHAVLCLINTFCAWETLYYFVHGEWKKSLRRFRGTNRASIGLTVHYHSVRSICSALAPAFRLSTDHGIGLTVPPSYVRAVPSRLLEILNRLDRQVAASLPAHLLADHRLLVFQRSR